MNTTARDSFVLRVRPCYGLGPLPEAGISARRRVAVFGCTDHSTTAPSVMTGKWYVCVSRCVSCGGACVVLSRVSCHSACQRGPGVPPTRDTTDRIRQTDGDVQTVKSATSQISLISRASPLPW